MIITKITVSLGIQFEHPHQPGVFFIPGVEIAADAELSMVTDDGEDCATEVTGHLQDLARRLVAHERELILEDLEDERAENRLARGLCPDCGKNPNTCLCNARSAVGG